jgi:hypothetical protein
MIVMIITIITITITITITIMIISKAVTTADIYLLPAAGISVD